MEPVPFARLIDEVRALAAERPSYVDPRSAPDINSCSYVTDERGEACIFGQAFARLGLPANILGTVCVSDLLCRVSVRAFFSEKPTPPQRSWCQLVQSSQDRGTSWGSAVAHADQYFERA
jgi:hypothetical protein